MSKHASKGIPSQKGKTKKEACTGIVIELKSEVARLSLLIEREYEAAEQLRSGFAITARHDFITARMENIGRYHERLIPLVGENEANRLLCETFSGGDSSPSLRSGLKAHCAQNDRRGKRGILPYAQNDRCRIE